MVKFITIILFIPIILFFRSSTYIVFIGESNSTGKALNSDAFSYEIGVRKNVFIWDNANNTGFLPLNIGVNNIIGNVSPTFIQNQTLWHGWELELANEAESKNKTIYLSKYGQGGTKTSDWLQRTQYGGYWVWNLTQHRDSLLRQKFTKRHKTYICMSLGINDAINHTDPTVYYNDMVQIISNLRNLYGQSIPIFLTHIPRNNSYYAAIDDKITLLGTIKNVTLIQVSDAPLQGDGNHWSYAGCKLIGSRMFKNIF